MQKAEWVKYLKLLIGAVLAIAIASVLSLKFAYAAGIITLLTIQDTKKETLRIAVKRIIIFVIMTLISLAVFSNMGYTLCAFGVVMVPYLLVCMLLNMREAIAPIAVLCTHYISEQNCSPEMIWNEFLILMVGAGIGIILNLFIPDNKIIMKRKLQNIEDKMREIFASMAAGIEDYQNTTGSGTFIEEVDSMLDDLKKESIAYGNNHLLSSDEYYYEYVLMRMEQCRLLKQINQDIKGLSMVPEQARKVADYFKEISVAFHETNNAEVLLAHLDELYEYFRSDRLPETREEFENRALLFHIIESMRSLVTLKKIFLLNIIRLYYREEIDHEEPQNNSDSFSGRSNWIFSWSNSEVWRVDYHRNRTVGNRNRYGCTGNLLF